MRPVLLAIRANIFDPISSSSWNANTTSGQFGRASVRCEPDWRFTCHPIFARAANLIVVDHLPQHRRALLIAAICFTGFGAIFTIAYVYPINAVLFEQAGWTQSADEIRALASRWILFDRIRFVIGLVGFAAVLHAFRLPIPAERVMQKSTTA